jgi:hypothetical protein
MNTGLALTQADVDAVVSKSLADNRPEDAQQLRQVAGQLQQAGFPEAAKKIRDWADKLEAQAKKPGLTTGQWIAIGIGGVAVLGLFGYLFYADVGHRGARENPASRARRSTRRFCPTGSKVQTLIFPRRRFTISGAKSWAQRHGYSTAHKIDVTANSIRIRQLSPEGWARLRTISMGPDVKAVVGWRTC